MNKKIKVFIGIIIFLLILIISNNSFALIVTRNTHIDPWTGAEELVPNGGGTTAQGATMCIQRGGAIRFTPDGIQDATKPIFPSYYHAHDKCESYSGHIYAQTGIKEAQKTRIIVQVQNAVKILAESEANQSYRVWAKYGDGRYSFQEVQLGGNKIAKSRPYTIQQTYSAVGSNSFSNSWESYVLSASTDFDPVGTNFKLKKGNYTKTISDQADVHLVQDAVWCSPLNTGKKMSSPAIAMDLYNEAIDYSKIASQLNAGSAQIVDVGAQVIANRQKGTYIIGPYKLVYPNDTRFYYVQDMYITSDSGARIATPTVISSSGSVYPKSGDLFFLEFDASDAGNPSSVAVKAEFAYLSITKADITRYEGSGDVYQLVGELIESTTKHNTKATKTVTETTDEIIGYKDGKPIYKEVEKEVPYECTTYIYEGKVYQVDIGDYVSQNLIEVGTVERDWKETERMSPTIYLRMELGGYVWEDADKGKESVQDGKYTSNSEKKVPNVIVTLYNENGTQVAKTKTDANGSYRFSGLDAMEQYSVRFTYNGQYYQPTIFSGSNTWGKSGWKTNSNAKDNQNERLAFNKKFESIGSSPENYKGAAGYNETFSKQDLLGMTLNEKGVYVKTREAVIDEFGNLILEKSSDATTQKMIQYVKDCLINAYTFDLYPEPYLFVIDTFQYPSMLTPNASVLYDDAYYINLGLNPREQSDLAIKKDIEKVTLEVNGQEHIYTYDTLENKENAENTWDISLRLSDAMSGRKYYDTNYSREIYTSDYLYKVSDYGANYADYGKTKADELEVYITYKVMVRNQALSIQARVDEIVDYYDEDLSYVDERSYIQINTKENTERYAVLASLDNSKFVRGKSTKTEIEGYNNLYITGLAGQIKDTKDNIIQQATLLIDEKGNTLEEKTEGVYLEAGQTAYVYLTFKVNKETKDNEDWVILDEELQIVKEIGVGKENIVEINGYSTRYAPGTTVPNVYETDVNGNIVKENGKPKLKDVGLTPAGIVDRDSKPGNLNPLDVPKDGKINYENFEDDTDKAPNIRIKLDRDDNKVRVISGTVFEDERTESIGVTTTGDGIRDSKDKTLINGVTVQLVELMENGTEFIWRTFENGSGTADETSPIINKYNLVANYTFGEKHNGAYAFKSFMPGKYVVRFIYGDTVKTVTPSSLKMGGLNEKSYNGQDYKSTTYQEGIAQNKTYTWREASTWVNGQETLGKVLTEVTTFKADASNNETANAKTNQLNAYLYDITASDKISNVSDAKDIESRRNVVNDYSDNDVINYIAEVLASHKKEYQDKSYKTANDKQTLLNDLMANTQMIAETGLMVIEFEYDQAGTDGNKKDNSYKIQNVDLGLEERPKAQLVIDKEVTNVKLTLANGSILFDAKNTASNVLWRDHKFYQTGYSKVSYKGGNETEKANFMNYELFGNIENIRSINASKFGLIQLSMDEELMHGATIEITYKLTVTNVGEVDYYNTYQVGDAQVNMCDRKFYYTGNKSENAKVVTTRANQVIDYVANNLQFNVNKNSDWQVISKQDLLSQGLVNSSLEKQVEQFNTIIVTKNLSKQLVPVLSNKNESTVSVPLVLTQLITSENDSDDLSYRNIVEIVQTSNSVARRMEYSVVGNQNPSNIPQELDSDIAEVVRILPPFGNAGLYIIITLISLIALGIVTLGIIFIKKKIIKK